MKYLLFDTETTGLPLSRNSSADGPNNWPHIVSISWVILNSDTNQIETKKHFIIEPSGWTIPPESTAIHGITTDIAIAKGFPLRLIMSEFLSQKYDVLVAHNLNFDLNVIDNAIRWDLGMRFAIHKPKFCTMELSRDICRMPARDSRYGFKSPKLSELYQYVFKRAPDSGSLHNSLYDTMVLAEIVQSCDELRVKMNLPAVNTAKSSQNEDKKNVSRILSLRLGDTG